MTTELDFRMLGPLEVTADGHVVDLGPGRQRAVLALLLLHANRVVSSDRLVDDLWGAAPPASAGHALQVYVSNLRKTLDPGRPPGTPGERIVTRRPGYMLVVPPGRLDAVCFQSKVAEGRLALADDHPEAATEALGAALDLCHGPALADLADEPSLRAERTRLEELRLGATEDRVEADLALGRHVELVGELEVLVGSHPLRERLWGQLLLALYRCGRQADALRAYQRLRVALAEELGLEPATALRQMEQAILSQDPELDFRPRLAPRAKHRPERSTAASVTKEQHRTEVVPPEEPPLPSGQGRPERRNVTAMAVGLSNCNPVAGQLDAEELRLLMERALAIVHDAVETYGGTFCAAPGDGLLALFGVPVAHEDDPERAIRAGLRVAHQIGAFGVDVARSWGVEALSATVGVSTGPVVVGPEGADAVERYAGEGRALTTAASLASFAAPGRVLVATPTHRLTAALFDWGDVRHLAVEGEDHRPLMAHEAIAPLPVSARLQSLDHGQTELVGREKEVAAGGRMVDSVLAGAGGVLFVSGEAGIGKSRLVAELRRRFEKGRSAGGRPLWMEGRCASYGQSLPYGPFRELLREWLGTSPQQPELRTRVALRRQVEALFGEEEVRLQPLLASVLGLPLEREASEVLAHLAPDSLQTAVFDAVASLVRRLAGDGPVVVAIDDVHWADPTSVQLMDHLMAMTETDAVLLVAVGRPERDHPSWSLRHVAAQRFGHRAHDIVLEPLTGEADARMLESLLGDATLPAEVAERLLGVAEGNPFFIEELVRFLVEAGTLVQTTDGWRWDGDTAVEVPQTVERVLVTRIDRLSPRSRDVLSAASVVGRQFAVELVEAVSDPGTDVAAAFSELQRLDLIREVRRWPRREYRFKHALVQEAAYGTLVDDWRRELHRRAAHGIEMLVPDRVAESYALLAHHCARAGEIPRAMAYFRLAGDGATQMNAVEEAIGHYSAGVGLETSAVGRHDQATMAALHLGRGRLLWQRGDQRAEEDFESALGASRETGDRTTELAALEGIGLVAAFLHGRRTEAIGRFEHAFALARACGDDSAAVTFANRLTIESVHRLELDRALDWGEEARACADRAGTDRALARALDGRKLVAAALGDLPMLGALTRRLERILRAQNDLWYLKHALAESSLEAAGRGRFAESSDRLTEALDINDRLGNQVDRSYFLTLQAWVERSRGAYGLALRLAREAVALADENPRGLWQAWSEANLGVIHLELGSPTQAIAHFDRGRQAADRAGVGMQYVRCCSHLAWVYWTIGDERRSAESLEQADHLLSEVRVPAGKAWLQGVDAYLSVARTHQARGDGHRGVKLLRPLLVPARESGWYEAISSVALGLSASSASDVGELLLREALRSAELGGVKPLEWQCHHALGEALRVGGRLDEAVMHTNRALQIRCALAGSLADPVFSRELLADQPPPAR